MRSKRSDRSQRFLTVLVVVALSTTTALPCPVTYDRDDRMMADARLRMLWIGTPEQRREAVVDLRNTFLLLEDHPDNAGLMTPEEIEVLLGLVVASDPDEYVVATMLKMVGPSVLSGHDLSKIFVDAGTHPSPNVRYQVARFFTEHEENSATKMLEAMWRIEDRDWIRPPLIIALDNQGSKVLLDDIVELAGSEDLDVAAAAVEALAGLDDAKARSRVIDVLGSGRRELVVFALHALGNWSDAPDALEAVIDASGSADEVIRGRAILVLSHFEDESATRRLVEIATGPDRAGIRTQAICALERNRHPSVLPAMFSIATDRDVPKTVRIAAAVWLDSVDDELAEPLIEELGLGDRDRAACFVIAGRITHLPMIRVVRPLVEGDGVGCSERPGGEPVRTLEAGKRVRISDRFEIDGDLWSFVWGRGAGCWVPDARLEQIEPWHYSP